MSSFHTSGPSSLKNDLSNAIGEVRLQSTDPSLLDDLSGVIGEYSIPHVTEMSSDSLLTQSQYAKVIFHDIADTYSTDADVCCRYSLTEGVIARPGDRISLYRVGWSVTNEYLAYEWTPVSQNSRQKEFQVLFEAATLPKDITEFYQFCYLTSDSDVCGASIPFQFRRPQEDDLCVVEGPGDMVVVRSRSAVTEERLRQAEKTSEKLQMEKLSAEQQLQAMTDKFNTLTTEFQTMVQQFEQMKIEKQSVEKELSDMAHLDRLVEGLKQDYQVLDGEKNESRLKVQKLQHQNEVLTATIKALTTDKEHLSNLLRTETRQHADADQYRTQTDGLQAMLEALTQSKELVAQELHSEQQKNQKLCQELEETRKLTKDLQIQITGLDIKKRNLEVLLEQSLSNQSAGSSSLVDGETAFKLFQLQEDKEKLLVDLTRMAGTEQELANMRGIVQKRTEECGALQQQLKNARLALHERDTNLTERNVEIKSLQWKLSEKSNYLSEMEEKLKNTEEKAGDDKTKLERIILAKRINELEQEKMNLTKLLDEAKIREKSSTVHQDTLVKLQLEMSTSARALKEARTSEKILGERISVVQCRLRVLDHEMHALNADLSEVMRTYQEQLANKEALKHRHRAEEQKMKYELGISAASDDGYFNHVLQEVTHEIQNVEMFCESSEMRATELKLRKEEMCQERTVLEQQLEQNESLLKGHEENVSALENKLRDINVKMAELKHGNPDASLQRESASTEQESYAGMLQDLKMRLQLAAAEYQKLYQDKQKAERRLAKLLNRKVVPSNVDSDTASEPAVVQDLLSLSQSTDPSGEMPAQVVVGGPNFCFMCPFCSVTFPPGAYDLFTHHFDNHIS